MSRRPTYRLRTNLISIVLVHPEQPRSFRDLFAGEILQVTGLPTSSGTVECLTSDQEVVAVFWSDLETRAERIDVAAA